MEQKSDYQNFKEGNYGPLLFNLGMAVFSAIATAVAVYFVFKTVIKK